MLYEEWKSRYKNLKNFNTVLQRCPRFWPLAPPRGMNPGVYSLGISEDPPRYLSSKFDVSVRSDCWDISIWKTSTQCDGNGYANANADDRGDYNSSPYTSYRRAKKVELLQTVETLIRRHVLPCQIWVYTICKLNNYPFRVSRLQWLKDILCVAKWLMPTNIMVYLFVLRFYGLVNPMGSCRVRSVYLTTRLLGRLSPLSG